MKDKKVEYRYFSVFQYKDEQEYLRLRHKNGWSFAKVYFPGFYLFERCEPEDVIYQLDYNKEGRAHRAEYVQMYNDCGWEYLQDFVGYSYFRKPESEMNGDEEIFSDEASRRDFANRVLKSRIIPAAALVIGYLIFLLILSNIR